MPYSASPPPPVRIRWRRGRVTATGRRGRDSLELTVEVPEEGQLRALAYPSMVGIPQVGDEVLLNTTALAQGLGTGGVRAGDRRPRPAAAGPDGPGAPGEGALHAAAGDRAGSTSRRPSTTR